MILDNLRRFWQIYIIAILAMMCFIWHNHYKTAESKLANCEVRIQMQIALMNQMKIEGDKLALRVQSAQKEAQKLGAQYDAQIKGIWNAPVSSQCEDAIKWGIQQAELF